MPDTSSAAHRRHAPECRSGLEPLDGTWFETEDETPADLPLLALVPLTAQESRRQTNRSDSG